MIGNKTKFYSLKNIMSKNAQYNMIFGERSNGKTYACLKYGIENYVNKQEQFALVRRYDDDLRGKRGASMFDALIHNKEIVKLTKGEWTDIYYYSGRWYFCKYDEKMIRIVDSTPFAYGFSLNTMEHDKSSSYPNVTTIIFDEFLTRNRYLTDEFVIFMNVLSTIIRHRNNVKIFMLGNTVNQYCPYFAEMGLKNIPKMSQGDIDVYAYGQSNLRVAVEYADSPNKSKDSDVYFAFNNPKLHMITDGSWELDIYPHCPCKYKPKDILFKYFIIFGEDTLQAEIIQTEESNGIFTFIHRKTTPIKDEDKELIYSPVQYTGVNRRRKITKATLPIEKKIIEMFNTDKVFYQDNEVGDIVRNYILWCKSN